MHFLIGCDEAGYGPNLGPLLISATAWQLPSGANGTCDLFETLSEVISPKLERRAGNAPRRLAIADSKVLYQSGGAYTQLELAVLVALRSLSFSPATWRELWPLLAPTCQLDFEQEPWHVGYDKPLPLHATLAEIDTTAARFQACLQSNDTRLMAMRADCIYPPRFNRLCHELGSKGLLLSTCTLRLLADMIAELPPGDCTVLADKHGGRNRYGALLQQAFDDNWVEVRGESRAESRYRIRLPERTVDISFRVGGEAALPTAWASLCCKYLRELAMDAFNAYWLARVENLRSTAGYPVDAKRFMHDIAEPLAAESIASEQIWRIR